MNKAQKVAVGFLIIAVLVIAILFFVAVNQKKNYYVCKTNEVSLEIILYYGTTCPHCKIVEQWMDENKVSQKINITQLEVFENQTNAQKLITLGNACKLPKDYIGAVPLLYANKKAYLGDKDIIEFLKNEIGVR